MTLIHYYNNHTDLFQPVKSPHLCKVPAKHLNPEPFLSPLALISTDLTSPQAASLKLQIEIIEYSGPLMPYLIGEIPY